MSTNEEHDPTRGHLAGTPENPTRDPSRGRGAETGESAEQDPTRGAEGAQEATPDPPRRAER